MRLAIRAGLQRLAVIVNQNFQLTKGELTDAARCDVVFAQHPGCPLRAGYESALAFALALVGRAEAPFSSACSPRSFSLILPALSSVTLGFLRR